MPEPQIPHLIDKLGRNLRKILPVGWCFSLVIWKRLDTTKDTPFDKVEMAMMAHGSPHEMVEIYKELLAAAEQESRHMDDFEGIRVAAVN